MTGTRRCPWRIGPIFLMWEFFTSILNFWLRGEEGVKVEVMWAVARVNMGEVHGPRTVICGYDDRWFSPHAKSSCLLIGISRRVWAERHGIRRPVSVCSILNDSRWSITVRFSCARGMESCREMEIDRQCAVYRVRGTWSFSYTAHVLTAVTSRLFGVIVVRR